MRWGGVEWGIGRVGEGWGGVGCHPLTPIFPADVRAPGKLSLTCLISLRPACELSLAPSLPLLGKLGADPFPLSSGISGEPVSFLGR